MKNFESGDRLLKDAEIYYEEMQSMYDKERWNIVVRRAQEVVELSLKKINSRVVPFLSFEGMESILFLAPILQLSFCLFNGDF